MKICIITFHFPPSCGAVLQAYALYHCLEQMGHEVEIVDYQPEYHAKQFRWQWKRCGLNGSNLRRFTSDLRFEKFRKRHLKTSRRYTTFEELQQSPPEADAYICGSDQIWSPQIARNDPAYFLDFAPCGTKRIAYAGSFGVPQIDDSDKRTIAGYFAKMDAISSRESSGVRLVQDMSGCDAKHVLDPCLLVDDYESVLTSPPIRKDYILVSMLQKSPLIEDVTRFIVSEAGLPVVQIPRFPIKPWGRRKIRHMFPSPDEYLGLFQNAKYIVTNSFHGTVFSLLFRKPFWSVALDGNISSRSVRITELLQSCGLRDRFIENIDETQLHKNLVNAIDWDTTHHQLHNQREASLQFLRESLGTTLLTTSSDRYYRSA